MHTPPTEPLPTKVFERLEMPDNTRRTLQTQKISGRGVGSAKDIAGHRENESMIDTFLNTLYGGSFVDAPSTRQI